MDLDDDVPRLVLDSGRFEWFAGFAGDDAPSHIFERELQEGHELCWSRLRDAYRPSLPRISCILVTVSVFDDLGTASLRALVRSAFSQLGATRVSMQSREVLTVYACGITTALALNIDGDSTGHHCEASILGVWSGFGLPETARRLPIVSSPEALSADSLLELTELAAVVLDSVMSAPIDLRRDLLGNIVVAGRATLGPRMQQFQEKLGEQLNSLLDARNMSRIRNWHHYQWGQQSDRVVKVVMPPERRFSVWIGGSIFLTLPDADRHILTQDSWETLFREYDRQAAGSSPKDGLHLHHSCVLHRVGIVPADPCTGAQQRQQRATEMVGHAASVQSKLPPEVVRCICSMVAQGMKWPLTRGLLQQPPEEVADWALRYDQQRPCSAAEMSEWAEWWPSLHSTDPACRVPACSLYATMGLAGGIDASVANAEAVRAEMRTWLFLRLCAFLRL